MTYDTMSVHGLERRLIEDHNARTGDFDAIDAALRKAVIQEASVGTMTKTLRQKGSIEWNGPSKRFHEGVYDLIPKEIP